MKMVGEQQRQKYLHNLWMFHAFSLLIIFSGSLALLNSYPPADQQSQLFTAATPEMEPVAAFQLQPQKLDLLFHRAALTALLKAKAKKTLSSVPAIERILFADCLRQNGEKQEEEGKAPAPAMYARCLVKLFDARDRLARAVKDNLPEAADEATGCRHQSLLECAVKWLTNMASTLNFNKQIGEFKYSWTNPKPAIRWTKPVSQSAKAADPRITTTKADDQNGSGTWVINRPRKRLSIFGKRLLQAKAGSKRRPSRDVGQQQNSDSDGSKTDHSPKRRKYLDTLWRLQSYMEQRKQATEYLERLSRLNIGQVASAISSQNGPQIGSIKFGPSTARASFDLAKQLESILAGAFDKTGKKSISVLSPRLFSLFGGGGDQRRRIGKLLSPNLLGFQEGSGNDAIFSLPRLFQQISLSRSESLEWMELILELSGTGRQLDALAQQLGPEMEQFERKLLPSLRKLAKMDAKLAELKASLDAAQRRDLQAQGFTVLDKWQRRHFATGENEKAGGDPWDEAVLEQKIRELAKLADINDGPQPAAGKSTLRSRARRNVASAEMEANEGNGKPRSQRRIRKRQTTIEGGQVIEEPTEGGEAPDTEHGHFPRTVILSPAAFVHRVDGVILEGVYLSPHAFASEVISPEFMTIHVLSPSAFVAAILSPMAMTARILGPWAFRAEILSPEAFSAYVLNPDVFMAEVLSPKAFEPRVLSPKSMFIQVLTPIAASPRVGSPESMGLVILSPNILSPRINSTESLLIEVLSPHILGGEHEGHEDDQELAGGTIHIVGSGPPSHHHHGEHDEHGGHGHGHGEHGGHEHGGHEHTEGGHESGHEHGQEGGHENGGHEHEQGQEENAAVTTETSNVGHQQSDNEQQQTTDNAVDLSRPEQQRRELTIMDETI